LAVEPRRIPDNELPKRIGRYEAFLQIGAGGMARVYLAVQKGQPGSHQVVVVKVLRREAIEDDHVLALFMDEARIAMRLQHPNVIRTREVVAEPPDYLLAMDFHDGQSLLQVLRRLGRQAVPLDEHIWVLTKVLSGLGHAHELKDVDGRPLGIVHRDVSPSNVLVCYTGEIKLLDFGIAKATGALAATQDGVVKGKLGYAAPEQCLGKPADPRSDIYAVGVMLWEAIAGRRRASGETWHSVLQARIDDSEPLLEEVCPEAPAALSIIARKALAHEPELRYATAKEFQTDLEAYLSARQARIGPGRIAGMLRPHFDQDRAEQHKAIESFLSTLRSHVSGQRRRVPLPGPIPSTAPPADDDFKEEEDTSKIPVDDALLIKSRRGSMMPPPDDSVAVNAKVRPLEPMSTGAAQNSNTVRPDPASLPPGAVGSAAPPARASLPPSGARLSGPPVSGRVSAPPASGRAPSNTLVSASLPPELRASAPPASSPSLDAFAAEPAIEAPASSRSSTPALPLLQKDEGAPPSRFGKPAIVIGAGAAVFVAVLAISLLRKGSNEAAAPAATGAGTHADNAAITSTGTSTAAPSPSQVSVRLSVDPPDAEMRLDGRLLKGNPFVSVFPREDSIHELAASADGYREEKQVIQFTRDVDLTVSLHRSRGGAARTYPTVRGGAAPAAAQGRAGTEARPAAPGVEPGMDLQGRPERAKRNIDEKDPYSQ
jgi:serine/threonine-protein kinase